MSKVLIITISAIVIIAVGAMAFYITQRQEVGKVKEQPVGTIPEEPVVQPPEAPSVPEPKPEPTPQPEIDTSDWRTYRNVKYGFEVKYPKTWRGPFFSNPEAEHLAKDELDQSVAITISSNEGKPLWEFANTTAWQRMEYFIGVKECRRIKSDSGIPGVQCVYIFETSRTTPWVTFFETNSPKRDIVVFFSSGEVADYTVDFNPEIFDAVVKSFKYINR